MRSGAVTGASRTAWRWLALLVVALVVVAGWQRYGATTIDASPAAAAAPARGPASYDEALLALDRDVVRERYRAGVDPSSWMRVQGLAIVLHARGQMTGSHADLAEALAVADQARSVAPEASGPVLARAVTALSLHRNDIAVREVAHMENFAIAPDAIDRSEAQAILGDVALYGGKYRTAKRHYEAARALDESIGKSGGVGIAVRMADWHRHMGEFAAAQELLGAALAKGGSNPWTRAMVLLQIGAIDLQTGQWQAAEARFDEADRAFPGWWLAKAHLGQMAAVRGDFARAEVLYGEAMQGAERPSVMDALAAVLVQVGRDTEAEALTARSRTLWLERVASHPAAYADHAFDAVLATGDTVQAWQLAAFNYRTRPYGDGRIGLARAAAARGRYASARAVLEELERTGWRSTEQYRVMSDVCERLGDGPCAKEASNKALAISQRAFDPRAGLLFFSNH